MSLDAYWAWQEHARNQTKIVFAVWGSFWVSAVAGTIWLAAFNWRRLNMTDDFAAISSASLAGLLLLCVLEFYSISKWGMERLTRLNRREPSLPTHAKRPAAATCRPRARPEYRRG